VWSLFNAIGQVDFDCFRIVFLDTKMAINLQQLQSRKPQDTGKQFTIPEKVLPAMFCLEK
jgi:hypothetical protein